MTNPSINNTSDNNLPGGPPMVKIDGAAVRRIREKNGLTQLYVATVVQVTTETISRWENRRYPSIKKENAEKLAEALAVELAELLEREETPPLPETSATEPADAEPVSTRPVPPAPSPPPIRRRTWSVIMVLMTAAILIVVAWYRLTGHPEPLPVSATRVLPAHIPPGQDFPVLLRVSSPLHTSFALIIRENHPTACRFTIATPATTAPGGRAGQITWVSRLEGGDRFFAYRLTSPETAVEGTILRFQGQVVAGGRAETPISFTGTDQMLVAPYHWADRDADNRIDDEEILWVYDLFGTLEGFDDLRDEVDLIWTAGGYSWDADSGRYRVLE